MPFETTVTVVAIIAVFAFFAAVLSYSDMTWNNPKK